MIDLTLGAALAGVVLGGILAGVALCIGISWALGIK
jgi:hypothetical protein